MNLIETIHHAFTQFIVTQYPQQQSLVHSAMTFMLNVDEAKKNFGDISSNAALILAKDLGKNPREIATTLSTFIHPSVSKIEIAGPGFLNFFLTEQAFKVIAHDVYKEKESFFKLDATVPRKKISLEFVSANPTGPLHLGHGRGAIIGDVLGNILNFIGHAATKEFYINDAGSQMHKLGLSLKIRCQQLLGNDIPLPEDAYHGEYLIDLAKECIKTHGQEVINQSLSFFSEYGKEHLLKNIEATLKLYCVTFDVWFSEKTLHDSGAITKAIQQLTDRGYTYEQDGALWFKSTEFGDDKDRVLRKSGGELTYAAADVAYLSNKISREFDALIMVLGQDHHSYVIRLKSILQALGYNSAMLDVILYQLVSMKESGELVRMSKRAGKIVTLKDVIETVGPDVARFFYLNRKADAHLDFDLDLALKKTEENPVYYIQYAYVRIHSILQKAQESPELLNINADDIQYLSEAENHLLKKIISLKELLTNISHHYQTHLLTYYALELAHAFHSYYSKNRVIDLDNVKQSRARLVMIELLKNSFALSLTLLGISKPEKM